MKRINKLATATAAIAFSLTSLFTGAAQSQAPERPEAHDGYTQTAALSFYSRQQAQVASAGQFLIHLGTENFDPHTLKTLVEAIETRTGYPAIIAEGDMPITFLYINGAPGRPLTADAVPMIIDNIEDYAHMFGLHTPAAPVPRTVL